MNSVCAGACAHRCACRDRRMMSDILIYHSASFPQTGSLVSLELSGFDWLSRQPASLGNLRAFPCSPNQFLGERTQVHPAISGLTRSLTVTWGSLCWTGWPVSKASDPPVSGCPALGSQVHATIPIVFMWCWGGKCKPPCLCRKYFSD